MFGRRFLGVFLALSLTGTVAAASPLGSGVLAPGADGPAVRTLQEDLASLGYAPGPADGLYGPRTAAAVRAFQNAMGRSATGILGNGTRSALTTALELADSLPILSPGSVGTDVRGLQTALENAGFFAGPANGIFGPPTTQAVMAFQRAAGLSPDGVVGPATWAAMLRPRPSLSDSPDSRPLVWAYAEPWPGTGFESSLRKHLGGIDVLSPYWYSLTPDGTIRQHGTGQSGITSLAHAAGVKVVPLVNNAGAAGSFLRPGPGRERALTALVNLVETGGYDGINIDFEGLGPTYRPLLTSFVEGLGKRLHAVGRLVAVDVGARASGDPAADPAGYVYDYQGLGQAADYVIVMTYDLHSEPGDPGPVAPYNWVRAVSDYALTRIPASKLILGLADYGYDWSASGMKTVSAEQAEAAAPGITWDAAAREPRYTYYDGNRLRHVVWFESGDAAYFKARLSHRLGLAGVSLWYLGGEDGDFWTELAKGLGG